MKWNGYLTGFPIWSYDLPVFIIIIFLNMGVRNYGKAPFRFEVNETLKNYFATS